MKEEDPVSETGIERTYEARTPAGATRQRASDARRLADEGYRPTGETLAVVNPEAPKHKRIYRLTTVYRG